MVLQQGKPIRIWGWAEPGKSVSVTVTQDKETGDKFVRSAIASGTRNESSSKPADGYSVTVQYVEVNAPEPRLQSVEVIANWPTGNMVGRERLPLATFRTDDWPLPEGVSYSEDAKKAASELLEKLQVQAKKQALDRRLRQIRIDQSKTEAELHKGDAAGLIDSKMTRLKSTLDELLDPDATGRMIRRDQPELRQKLETLRKQVKELHPDR